MSIQALHRTGGARQVSENSWLTGAPPAGELGRSPWGIAPMWTLDEIVRRLNKHRQRATYGAVAGALFGDVGRARGLMSGRPHSHEDSWIVAKKTSQKTGSRRGWPTGYINAQIHPDCIRQIFRNPAGFIDDPDDLEQWLNAHA